MRVLFQNRPDVFSLWGGDTTQMVSTKEHLQRLGVSVDVSTEAEADLVGWDLVHVFNIQTADHGIQQVRHARRRGLPVVVSPIYWDMRHIKSTSKGRRLLAAAHRQIPYGLLSFFPGYANSGFALRRRAETAARQMLEQADLLLPNSYAEAEILALLFDAPWLRTKVTFVPNGCEPPSANFSEQEPLPPLPRPFVLQVGRVEPIKGQLLVLRALADDPQIPLVFVGKVGDATYARECTRLAQRRGNAWLLGEVPHEKLAAYYQCAQAHVLPSLRESPGLATLEAAIRGVNCVVSFHGPVAEYFGGDVWYCDPADPVSIRHAILGAWSAPASDNLRTRILRSFTWEAAAKATLEAYHRAFAEHGKAGQGRLVQARLAAGGE
jgi:glycosyltransferase involved in cell wall biosynthesis